MARDLSVLVRSFNVSAPAPDIIYDYAEGLHGQHRMGKTYGSRTINAECEFYAEDSYDSAALRDELFKWLFRGDEYFIVNENSPGKRWRVEVSASFNVDRVGIAGAFTIPFISAQPFAESRVRTSDNEFRFDSKLLQWGMGIPMQPLVYRFTTPTFRVYNAGDVSIDWRNAGPLLSYRGASTNLRIRNITTGSDWRWEGTTVSIDIIRLHERARSTKNSLSIFRQSNYGVITLAPGWNEFLLDGTSGTFEVSFDFRFLYF